jgi:lipid-binding SYLF domain-containing protein
MRKILAIIVVAALPTLVVLGDGETKEQKRLQECGQVMKDILNIPDALPKELLDRAECVIVIPSVKKAAIGIGGSYGRGAIT